MFALLALLSIRGVLARTGPNEMSHLASLGAVGRLVFRPRTVALHFRHDYLGGRGRASAFPAIVAEEARQLVRGIGGSRPDEILRKGNSAKMQVLL